MNPGYLLLAAFLGVLTSLLVGRKAARVWLGGLLLGSVMSLAASLLVLSGATEWLWRSQLVFGGESIFLRLDAVSAFFLALLSVLSAVIAVYSREYWSEAGHPHSAAWGRVWWSGLILSFALVLLVSNSLHFLIVWETFTISAYFLITLNRQRQEVRAAGWLYLVASHVGTLALFAYFGLIAAHTGSWELGPMREQLALAPLFWLALFGFGVKAGIFPVHVWLPSAHANAPSHVSAILSGMAIKMGIYGLVRFSGWLPVPGAAGWVVAGVGMVSAVLGVAFALGQHDLKRLLAYHSVENIGIILIGLGFAMLAKDYDLAVLGQLALAGCLLHVWNHGLFKALLFLAAGSVLHATGTREMSQLGGLWRKMPWTTALFALGAVAISGLPPLNGFVSEWLIYLGLFDAVITHNSVALLAVPAVVLLAMTGALALACFVKACGVVFLGAPRSRSVEHAHEGSWLMRGPMLVLAGACVAIGLAPVLFWPALARTVGVWQPTWVMSAPQASLGLLSVLQVGVALLVVLACFWLYWKVVHNGLKRELTWDCGYAVPTARMQYTAGSFAATLTEWFAWILRPQRHEERVEETFPSRAHYEEHTPETVLERVLGPLAALTMMASTAVRRLQHGRLQAYLVYLLVGLMALAALVMRGGGL